MNLLSRTELRAQYPTEHAAEKRGIQERIEKAVKRHASLLAQGTAIEVPIGDYTKTVQDWAKLSIDREDPDYTCHIVYLGSETVMRLRIR